MDYNTFSKAWGITNAILHISILLITYRYCVPRYKTWELKYAKRMLNQQQVKENIRNGMRIDYATGIENNWKNTWNPSRPRNCKWKEYSFITVKAFLLFIALRTIGIKLLIQCFVFYVKWFT